VSFLSNVNRNKLESISPFPVQFKTVKNSVPICTEFHHLWRKGMFLWNFDASLSLSSVETQQITA